MQSASLIVIVLNFENFCANFTFKGSFTPSSEKLKTKHY